MPTFKDNKGQTWTLASDWNAVVKIRDRLGINLLTLLDKGNSVMERLNDPLNLVAVVFLFCEAEADKRGVAESDFGPLLMGDPLDPATQALLEVLPPFFPKQKRAILQRTVTAVKRVSDAAQALVDQQIDSGELDRAIGRALSPSDSSTSAPASAG